VRVVVLHLASSDDVHELGPAVRAVRARWPDAAVAACVAADAVAAARLLPGVDRAVAAEGGLLATGRALAALRPDLALRCDRSARGALLARLSGARRRVGPGRDARGAPLLDRALSAAARAGAPAAGRELSLATPSSLAPASGVPLVAVVPGGPDTARWGVEKFGLAASAFLRAGANVAVLGAPSDAALAARVAELADAPIVDLTALPAEERLAALASSAVVVGGDVPLVHAARALGRPAVIVFGPTDPARHAFGASDVPLRIGIECQPCAAGVPPGRCPLGHLRCLTALAAQPVAEAALALLPGAGAMRSVPGSGGGERR
jgi:ADP-heptose:LPS heptosyltransferase